MKTKDQRPEKRSVGRPRGLEKEPVNVLMGCERAQRLREYAVKDQRTISNVVENALEAFGI